MFKKILITMLLISTQIVHSQSEYNFICGTPSSTANGPIGMGLTKPMKTLPTNDLNRYFRVLMVFVEFSNDNTGSSTYWPQNSMPVYYNQLFAPQKQLGINAYENYKISDYFNKVSRDQFDVIGNVVHVVLDHDYNYYTSIDQAQTDLFAKLDLDPNYQLNWNLYDLWSWNESTQQYEQNPDNYIDMIYVQWRHVNPFGIGWGGYGSSVVNYTTRDGKQISNAGINYLGSGVTGVNGANMPLSAVIGLFRHEYCHYALGGHKPYSTIAGGDGTQTAMGYEVGFSPMDMIDVGYDNTINFTPLVSSYAIVDLHSTGDLIKIQTGTPNEVFLVSNRRRIVGDGSGTIYDCNMAGDTAMGEPFRQFKDYSKGLYIYHVDAMNGFDFWADLECADGLWNWDLKSYTTTPDWSSTQQLPVFIKTGVGYNDDNPLTSLSDPSRMLSRDGHSVFGGGTGKWFTDGKRHVNLGEQGIDRIFTNLTEDWCSRECMGDRWDAWKIDYNVVFSPYSSPNTKDRNGNQTGIFIYYQNLDANQVATVKIYQGQYNTPEEEYALAQTPPSRPMGLELSYSACENGVSNPILTWHHNLEPDMIIPSVFGDYKIYKIYRTSTGNLTELPDENNYQLIATVNIPVNDVPTYRDNNTQLECNPFGEPDINYAVRYRITAVDGSDWESVKSDFVSDLVSKVYENRLRLPENTPKVFTLSQNFPNPFNPNTVIKYTIPYSGFVSLKVYNLLGEEVAELVNEYKAQGEYNVTFDGSNLASGVYFYKLETGNYTATKKMVLIK